MASTTKYDEITETYTYYVCKICGCKYDGDTGALDAESCYDHHAVLNGSKSKVEESKYSPKAKYPTAVKLKYKLPDNTYKYGWFRLYEIVDS